MSKLISIGHRGAAGHEPENTFLSIEKALILGADLIEIDVHSIDNELIVIHDASLKRTTNGTGTIYERSIQYIRSLDAGKGQRVPLLQEVFDCVNRRAGINIELKELSTITPLIKLMEDYIQNKQWQYQDIIVSSLNKTILKKIKTLQPQIKIGFVCRFMNLKNIQVADNINAYSIHPFYRFVTKRWIVGAHDRGIKVFPYTVNRLDDIERLKLFGVDGIFSDFPERVKQISRE
jgi:glycerophosphoryl diester phosphodiesterase